MLFIIFFFNFFFLYFFFKFFFLWNLVGFVWLIWFFMYFIFGFVFFLKLIIGILMGFLYKIEFTFSVWKVFMVKFFFFSFCVNIFGWFDKNEFGLKEFNDGLMKLIGFWLIIFFISDVGRVSVFWIWNFGLIVFILKFGVFIIFIFVFIFVNFFFFCFMFGIVFMNIELFYRI